MSASDFAFILAAIYLSRVATSGFCWVMAVAFNALALVALWAGK